MKSAASTPLTVGELAAKLAEFPPDATVYVSVVGASAAKPTRVRWGNDYNPKGDYVTVDNG